MKLEQQVISLQLAKRLKELGVKQESCFWYWEDAYGIVKSSRLENHQPRNPQGGWNSYAAFTVAELGEMLPRKLSQKLDGSEDSGYFDTILGEQCVITYIDYHTIAAPTEAEARGLMLAYLIENKFLSV